MRRSDRTTLGGAELSRRRLLLGAAAASAVAAGATMGAGCTPSDPRIDVPSGTAAPLPARPPNTAPPTPLTATTRPADPPTSAAAAGEQNLADLAAAILTGRHRRELSTSQRTTLTAVRDTHRQHRASLGGAAPTSRPPAPPELARSTLTQSLRLLAQHEQRQASRLRREALADVGYDALLWASMMLVAGFFAEVVADDEGVPIEADAGPRPPMPAVSDVEALQSMVGQLHAVIYGYQLALGQLSTSNAQGRRAMNGLQARRTLRDQLVQVLLSRSASVPAAEAAYIPSVDPSTARSSARLVRRMEIDLQPFCGLWFACANRLEDRRLALGALVDTAARARRWGAPITVWPGWQR